MTGDGGPPEIPETSHGSGSPCRGGSSRPRLAARRPRPALLARRARPGACLRRCKTQRFLELIERGQRLALGRPLARRDTHGAAQRLGLGDIPPACESFEGPDGRHVERVGRLDRRYGHTRRMVWPYRAAVKRGHRQEQETRALAEGGLGLLARRRTGRSWLYRREAGL